ncbi:MAG: three-Cys-motif partner protein TcmP [Fuerstia sp.]|nr:three-Cys-motif partner protein TcmP [Fuerstiella sp.]
MSDSLPTVWHAEPHTLVKHAILNRYLQAWFPILTQQASLLKARTGKTQSREILFVDGFAGPGLYERGEPGSPLIALNAAIQHSIDFPMPVRMLFIEHRHDRFVHLQSVIAPYLAKAKSSKNVRAVEPHEGDCDTVLNQLLDEFEKKRSQFGPALAFLDQFGYGAVSMKLIHRILSYPQCEVFSYLNYKEMNRWITDPHKADAFTRAFGGEEWRECKDLPEKERRAELLLKYKAALKNRANAKYVVSFLMFDANDLPLYWLLFCTNNLRGLEEMKRAMWAVDKTGEFRFSDNEAPGQLQLLELAFDDAWLAERLQSTFGGKTRTALAVKEYVLVDTPCYLFRGALSSLESDQQIDVSAPAQRKPRTFPDEHLDKIRITFHKKLFD